MPFYPDDDLKNTLAALANDLRQLTYEERMGALIFFLERAANGPRQIQWNLGSVPDPLEPEDETASTRGDKIPWQGDQPKKRKRGTSDE